MLPACEETVALAPDSFLAIYVQHGEHRPAALLVVGVGLCLVWRPARHVRRLRPCVALCRLHIACRVRLRAKESVDLVFVMMSRCL